MPKDSKFIIKRGKNPVINDYTQEPKLFDTKEAAESYATLSHFRGYTIEPFTPG